MDINKIDWQDFEDMMDEIENAGRESATCFEWGSGSADAQIRSAKSAMREWVESMVESFRDEIKRIQENRG